jgi:hypothetical protein
MTTRFSCHPVTDLHIGPYLGTLFDNDPAKFMSKNNGCPDGIIDIVMVDMQIRTTNTTGLDLDFNLFGLRWKILDLAQFDVPVTPRVFHYPFHCFSSV